MPDILMRFRQWTFPPELRIAGGEDAPGVDALVALLRTSKPAETPPSPGPVPRIEPRREEPAPSAGLNADTTFVVELANVYFRLQRTAKELNAKAAGSEETRRVARSAENLYALLREHRIECTDLEGERYDDGRRDFEPMPPPIESDSVAELTIGRCERPRVLRDGKLLQKGKGRVLRPRALQAGSAG